MADYVYTPDVHSAEAARAGFRWLFPDGAPASLLDVGCGNGDWLGAARDAGVGAVVGIDGSSLAAPGDPASAEVFLKRDLAAPFDLERRFDAVLCLEVAEHLPESSAEGLIASLCRHGDLVFFSAACPGQWGQGHLNCQWPAYWQDLFNRFGFSCSDAIRWAMWDDAAIKPWYRQNMFSARRDPRGAGAEPRIAAAVHPQMLPFVSDVLGFRAVDEGRLPLEWYVGLPFKAVGRKLARAAQRLAGKSRAAQAL